MHDGADQPESRAGEDESGDRTEHIGHELWHAMSGVRRELDRLERAARGDIEAMRATSARLEPVWERATSGEHRFPVAAVIVVAITLEIVLPAHLLFKPIWLLPVLESVLLVGLVIANPTKINRSSRTLRSASLTLCAVISLANSWSAALLVREIITGRGESSPIGLLGSGAAIYLTNIIVFGLWYWEFDRGGPVARHLGAKRHPDFLFPQYQSPELAPSDWGPRLADYLYVSFTNASAFSPTDVMPLSRWAKGIMFVQSGVSLITVALVVARAVNILK